MKVALINEVPTQESAAMGDPVRAGSFKLKRLFHDDAPDGFNFWFARSEHQGGEGAHATPRHHHTFAQIKFTEKGASNVAPGLDIDEGDLGYFPRAAYYGPQKRDTCTTFTVQFGFNGEHQRGKAWEDHRDEALRRLRERGTIENGLFVEVDPATGEKKVRDSVEALYDERHRMLKGTPLAIGDEGYEAPILMHPKAFAYFEVSPGVELKHLGRFYDQPGPNGDVGISMARLSDGGAFTLRADRPQIAWAMAAGLEIDGKTYPELTTLYSPRGEETTLSSNAGVEIHILEFPRLD